MLKAQHTYRITKEKLVLLKFLFCIFMYFTTNGQESNLNSNQQIADSLLSSSKQEVQKGDFAKALLSVEKGLLIYKKIKNSFWNKRILRPKGLFRSGYSNVTNKCRWSSC